MSFLFCPVSTQTIKKVLDSGECPNCGAEIITDDTMTSYFCASDKAHFNLEIKFHGGEKMTARLNGKEVPKEDLDQLDW